MEKEVKSLLDCNFLHSEKFKQKNAGQLKRIEEKLLILYELKHGNKIRNESEINSKVDSEMFYKEKKTSILECLDNKSVNIEIKQNFFVGIISFSTYLYFTRISTMFTNVHSIALFRPIFLFTFCGAPLLLSLYFSYMNIELRKLSQKYPTSF